MALAADLWAHACRHTALPPVSTVQQKDSRVKEDLTRSRLTVSTVTNAFYQHDLQGAY